MLEADTLSPLMCINIDVLFSINQVVRALCDMLVSAAGFINNDGRLKCWVAGLQKNAVWNKRWVKVCEVVAKSIQVQIHLLIHH